MFRGLRSAARPFVRLKDEGYSDGPSRSSRTEGEPWESSEVFVAFDVAKKKHAVAIAEGGRTGEVRFVGEVENRPAAIERTIKKLGKSMIDCIEAGPTGYGLCRQVRDLGHDSHDCMAVAPALIPKRPGEHVKTNRRDAVTLARLNRAGELTGVWVPDVIHEAVRDLVRARGESPGNDDVIAAVAPLNKDSTDGRSRRPLRSRRLQ